MFKKIFIDLCNERKESPSAVCVKLGLSPATYSCWTDESVPRRATLQRMADYFGVSIERLKGEVIEGKNITCGHKEGERHVARKTLTDMEVEQEITRLKASPLVALGRVEERIRNKRRQYLYTLRQYEKRGLELMAAGVTVETLLEQEKELKGGA